MSTAAMMLVQAAEARRRRDEKGRYMQGGERTYSTYMPYNGDDGRMMRGRRRNEMRYGDGSQVERVDRRRMDDDDDDAPQMGGEGWFAWDRMTPPWHLPPDRYGQPDEMRYEGGNVTDMRDYNRRRNEMRPNSHMEHDRENNDMYRQGKIGFGERDDRDDEFRGGHMTREKAEKWIRSMKTPDGKPLQHIALSEVQRIAPNYGVDSEHKMVEFWVVVNMVKSDYQDVGKKYANDAVDFYAALARDWLNDRDAVENKLKMYKMYIVKPEE